MSALNSDPEPILRELALIPTASFHEEAVARFVRKLLSAHEIGFTVDSYGNIIAHYRLGNAPQPLALVAHMDHPAFEVVSPHAVIARSPEATVATWGRGAVPRSPRRNMVRTPCPDCGAFPEPAEGSLPLLAMTGRHSGCCAPPLAGRHKELLKA